MALKKEKPDRSAAQVHRILALRLPAGQVPTVRTIRRHFARMALTGLAAAGAPPEAFGARRGRNLSNSMRHQAACVVCGGGLVSMVAGGSLIHTLAGRAFG